MATQSSTSDSIDDPNFQAFLREPLSNESSLAIDEVSTPAVEKPKSPPTLWWMKNDIKAKVTTKPKEVKTVDLTIPEAQLSWIKPSTSTLVPVQDPSKERSPQAGDLSHKTKEQSPGIVTSSADSMAEFLEKETEFKEESEKEREKRKDEDGSSDTLVDDEYAEDFTEDISDELYGASQADVKAIMQLLAKQLESVDLQDLDIPDLNLPEPTLLSGGSSRERSVEEILEEVEELERSTSRSSSFEKDKVIDNTTTTLQVTNPQPPPITKSTDSITTPTPNQASTPKPQDRLVEPADLSLKLPSSSVESSSNEQQGTFTVGPAGDSASLKLSNKVSDFQVHSKDTAETSKSRESNNMEKQIDKSEAKRFEELLVADQAKCSKLQELLDKRERDHDKQLENLKVEHEKEIFELKKQSYYLNAKVQDLEHAKQEDFTSARADHSSEVKVQLLETEVQKQEQLIVATQKENEKLCNQIKELKLELSSVREGSVSSRGSSRPYAVLPGLEQARLVEQLKDAKEKTLKLEIEIKSLKTKNKLLDSSLNDAKNKYKSAQENADKYQKLYKEASSHTVPPQKLASLKSDLEQSRADLKLKAKEVNDISTKLSQAQRHLGETKAEGDRLRSETQSLREKFRSLKETCSSLQETLEATQEDLKVREDQHEQDKLRIQDLKRQVGEMERILRRTQQSVPSVLNDQSSPNPSLLEHLENRVQQLTEQLAERGASAKSRVSALEAQFAAIKENYESYIQELEQKVSNITQRDSEVTSQHSKPRGRSPTKKPERPDEHLLATVRGLQSELAAKEKDIQKLNKELSEARISAKKLRDKLLAKNNTKFGEHVLTTEKPVNIQIKPDTMKNYEIANLTAQIFEQQQEMQLLKDQIKKLTATNQRLTLDFNTANDTLNSLSIQAQQAMSVLKSRYARNLQSLMDNYSQELSNSKLVEIQTQLKNQQAVNERLKEELLKLRESQQEVEMLTMEKEHLESCVNSLSKQITELKRNHRPESEQLAALRVKLETLEQKHQIREVRLQAVVKEILRHRSNSIQPPSAELATLRGALRHKNEQLVAFQAELGRLMTSLSTLKKHRETDESSEN